MKPLKRCTIIQTKIFGRQSLEDKLCHAENQIYITAVHLTHHLSVINFDTEIFSKNEVQDLPDWIFFFWGGEEVGGDNFKHANLNDLVISLSDKYIYILFHFLKTIVPVVATLDIMRIYNVFLDTFVWTHRCYEKFMKTDLENI